MTHVDLQEKFMNRLKALIGPKDNPFLSTEIEDFLNQSQDEYIESFTKIFERNETARKALKPLVDTADTAFFSAPAEQISPDSRFVSVSLSGGVSKVVQEYVRDDNGDIINVKPISHDQYNANRENPFKQPYEKLVWRLDVGGFHELVPSPSVTIDSYYYRFIKVHDRINFETNGTCQLRDVDMERIVDGAIKIALLSLGQFNAPENT